MKLSGPADLMGETWKKLGEGIVLEAPKGNDEAEMTFLGCEQQMIKQTVNGKEVRGMQWDVSHSMRRCVTKYEVAVQQCTGRPPRMTPGTLPSYLMKPSTHVAVHQRLRSLSLNAQRASIPSRHR